MLVDNSVENQRGAAQGKRARQAEETRRRIASAVRAATRINVSEAARLAGVHRSTVHRYLRDTRAVTKG